MNSLSLVTLRLERGGSPVGLEVVVQEERKKDARYHFFWQLPRRNEPKGSSSIFLGGDYGLSFDGR